MDRKFVFALDVDGVLTDGKFHWDKDGNKVYKEFGPDDADALKLLRPYVSNIVFYTQDEKGLGISSSRATHMGFPIIVADAQGRHEDIEKYYGFGNTIYMGDSFLDVPLLDRCAYGIATDTSSPYAKKVADYVTSTGGGERAVADAVFWIMKNVLDMDCVRNNKGEFLFYL